MKNYMKTQGGFSLIELLVAVVILSIISSVILSNMSTDKTKIVSLLDNMGTLHTSLARFNADTGCYPVRIEALFDKTQATGTATDIGFCTASVAGSITEPYMDATAYDAVAHAIKLPKIGANVLISTGYDGSGITKIWFMRAAGLSVNLLDPAVLSCNGLDAAAVVPTAWTNGVKCIKSGTAMLSAFNRK